MTEKKNLALIIAGYSGFFLGSFVLFLVLTFNASIFIPQVQAAARNARIALTVKELKVHRLIGVDLRGVEIAPLNPRYPSGAKPLAIDQLVVTPKLTALPALISAMASRKPPPLAFSFFAKLGDGKIEGYINQSPPALDFSAQIQKLSLDKITLPAYYLEGLQISGVINADCSLSIKDQTKPETWTGKFQSDLLNPKFSDFTFASIQVIGFGMDKGTLQAEVNKGTVILKAINLQGGEMPTDLTGTIALKSPLGRSVIELKGAINIAENYKQRMPLISVLIPSPNPYTYRTTLDALVPGL